MIVVVVEGTEAGVPEVAAEAGHHADGQGAVDLEVTAGPDTAAIQPLEARAERVLETWAADHLADPEADRDPRVEEQQQAVVRAPGLTRSLGEVPADQGLEALSKDNRGQIKYSREGILEQDSLNHKCDKVKHDETPTRLNQQNPSSLTSTYLLMESVRPFQLKRQ